MGVYLERNRVLASMGFPTYSHYLGSDLWKGIRQEVLRATPVCICGKTTNQVHHRNYAEGVLSGVDLTPLLPMCGRCHRKTEMTKSGKKRTFEEAEAMLTLLFQRTGLVPKVPKWVCVSCGEKARKGERRCRPCARTLLVGKPYLPSVFLPTCKGKDCTHQAAVGRDYCRIHEVEPDLSLKEYNNFRKRAKRAGVKL